MTQAQLSERAETPAWRIVMWGAITVLLLLPAVAMQFTQEVTWTGLDFAVAAALLIGAGVVFEVAARLVRNPTHRLAFGAGLVAVVGLIWLEGAVGIF